MLPAQAQQPTDMGEVDVKEASQAWEALFRAQVEIMRRLEADKLMSTLSLKEYDVLFALRNSGDAGLRQNHLNKSVLMHQSAFSRLLERLEARGLVERRVDPSDKRGTLISLTQEGRDVQRVMGRKHVAQIAHYVGAALTADELNTLEEIATKLRTAQAGIAPFEPQEKD